VAKLTQVQVFIAALRLSPVSTIPPILHTHICYSV